MFGKVGKFLGAGFGPMGAVIGNQPAGRFKGLPKIAGMAGLSPAMTGVAAAGGMFKQKQGTNMPMTPMPPVPQGNTGVVGPSEGGTASDAGEQNPELMQTLLNQRMGKMGQAIQPATQGAPFAASAPANPYMQSMRQRQGQMQQQTDMNPTGTIDNSGFGS